MSFPISLRPHRRWDSHPCSLQHLAAYSPSSYLTFVDSVAFEVCAVQLSISIVWDSNAFQDLGAEASYFTGIC